MRYSSINTRNFFFGLASLGGHTRASSTSQLASLSSERPTSRPVSAPTRALTRQPTGRARTPRPGRSRRPRRRPSRRSRCQSQCQSHRKPTWRGRAVRFEIVVLGYIYAIIDLIFLYILYLLLSGYLSRSDKTKNGFFCVWAKTGVLCFVLFCFSASRPATPLRPWSVMYSRWWGLGSGRWWDGVSPIGK